MIRVKLPRPSRADMQARSSAVPALAGRRLTPPAIAVLVPPADGVEPFAHLQSGQLPGCPAVAPGSRGSGLITRGWPGCLSGRKFLFLPRVAKIMTAADAA